MQQADFDKLLADALLARGYAESTQETYTLMLRLFGRYLDAVCRNKSLDAVTPDDIEAYQRYLVVERKVSFPTFNQSNCALRFFYRTCPGPADEAWPALSQATRASAARSWAPPNSSRGERGHIGPQCATRWARMHQGVNKAGPGAGG